MPIGVRFVHRPLIGSNRRFPCLTRKASGETVESPAPSSPGGVLSPDNLSAQTSTAASSTLRISKRRFPQQSGRRSKYPHRNSHRQRQQNERHQKQCRANAKDRSDYDYGDQDYQ